MNVEEFLKHYGTKGMKWGVRKSKVPKHGPSDDAKEAHRALVKAKVSGPEALTNKELNILNNRLNLEQNYDRLSFTPNVLQRVMGTVNSALKTGKTVNDAIEFSNSAAGRKLAASLSTKTAKTAVKKTP